MSSMHNRFVGVGAQSFAPEPNHGIGKAQGRAPRGGAPSSSSGSKSHVTKGRGKHDQPRPPFLL